jgi:hypothetical protein
MKAGMALLPDEQGRLFEEPEYFGERTFLANAIQRFPELADDPDINIGVHLSMAALGRLTVRALREGDTKRALATIDFLDEVLRSPRLHPEIRNAVAISFVDPGELGTLKEGRRFLDSMPATIRDLLR